MPSSRSASPTSRPSEVGTAGLATLIARKVALAPLLVAQALRTRRLAQVMPEARGERRGIVVGHAMRADPRQLRVLVAGDSSAAGVGVAHQDQAIAVQLARALQALTGRDVAWALHARSGLTTRGVHRMLKADPPDEADVAVVVSGVNDVVGQVSARRAMAHRAALADWLLGEGIVRHVAFAPLPPMHEFPLLPEPLRRVIGDDARRHDMALARWADGRSDVSRAAFVVHLERAGMAADGFHPGEPVYRACGEALAVHVAALAAAEVRR